MYSIKELQQFYQTYAEQHRFAEKTPTTLYEPVQYILDLGGKRLRPVMTLMAADLFNPQAVATALPAAYSVEVFHNFSLVHDDIMDAAHLRRGKPTVHTKYGLNTGILSGDVMLIYCYEYLLKLPPATIAQAIGIFNRVAIEVCEGQQLDTDFEKRDDVAISDYLEMITLKTAALLSGCLQLGALVGGATPDDLANLDAFGRNIGTAFQLQDDILDTFGDAEKFGKRIGGDIVQNKKTYLVLQTRQHASPADRAALERWMQTTDGDEEEKIAAVRTLFERYNAAALAEAEKIKFATRAYEHLEKVGVNADSKEPLRRLAAQLIDRDI